MSRLRTGTILIAVLLFGCTDARPAADPNQLVATGAELFVSEGCVNCHGADGLGLSGPPLAGDRVIETFPDCDTQIRWVSLGSARWRRFEGAGYGAPARPVRGGMPGFGRRLDDDQIRQVVIFTRVEFGGRGPDQAVDECSE